jgi:ParB/RepB/Spo0J family partition protein
MELEFHQLVLKYRHLRVRSRVRTDRLTASLASEGQQMPVLVVHDAPNRYVLIDGYRRVEALQLLGRDLVRVSVLELSEPEALVWTWTLARGGGRSVVEEAWLLRELHEAHALPLAELAIRFGRSKSWVSRRMALVRDVPDIVEASVRDGELSPQAAMKFLVPLARANASQCAELVGNLRGDSVSVRQMGRLYAAWRAGDEEQRARIVAHPRVFLLAQDELARGGLVETEDIWDRVVVRDLKMIAAIGRRVYNRLDRREPSEDSASRTKLLVESWVEACKSVTSLEPLLSPQSTGSQVDARP